MMSRPAWFSFRYLLPLALALGVAAALLLALPAAHDVRAQTGNGSLSLAVTERTQTSLTAQWSEVADAVTYTVILSGGDDFQIHTASPGEDTHTFTGLQPDFRYELSVSAFRSDASSAGEVQITARTMPKPPPTPTPTPVVVPAVSVAAGPDAAEGSDAVFTITASPASASDLTVELTITAAGDVIGEGETGPQTVTVPASGSVTYAVSTVDDEVVESPGTITATLVSASGGYVIADAPHDAATVSVTSEDWLTRTPTISASQSRQRFSEYRPSRLGLDFSPSPDKPLLVNVRLTQEGDFYDPADLGIKQILIPANERSSGFGFEINPIDDHLAEPEGKLTLEVLPGTGYRVGPYKRNTRRVYDRDLTDEERKNHTPTIVARRHSYVSEGEDVWFSFYSLKSLASPLPITVEISQDGDFVAPEHLGTHQLTIPAAPSKTWLKIPTLDDQVDEPDGGVEARVLPGDGYVVGEAGIRGRTDRSAGVNDDDEVEFPVSGGADITEGGEAVFTVSASAALPAREETVTALVSQGGDFVDAPGSLGLRTLTLTTGQSITVRVATDDDSVDEADGWVSLTIEEGATTRIGVADDDGSAVAQAGDCAEDTSTTCVATVDGKVSGELDSHFDRDWYSVSLTGGQTYRIQIWGFGPAVGVHATTPCLYDAAGDCALPVNHALGRAGYYQVKDGVVTPTESGAYFIGVQPPMYADRNQYHRDQAITWERWKKNAQPIAEHEKPYVLEVTTVTDDYSADATTTGQVTVNGSAVTGLNEHRIDVDWFQVDLTAGQDYLVYADSTLTKSGLLHPLHVRVEGVYDSDGNRIEYGVESPKGATIPDARIIPETSGSYYVAVTGNRNNYDIVWRSRGDNRYATCLLTSLTCSDRGSSVISLGNGVEPSDWHNGGVPYQLTVVTPVDDYADNEDTTGSVVVGGSLTGVIDYPGDVDWIAVTLPPGNLYEFKVEGAAANDKTALPDPYFIDLWYAHRWDDSYNIWSASRRWAMRNVGKSIYAMNRDDMGWLRPSADHQFFSGYENIYYIGVRSAENDEEINQDTGAYKVSVSIVPQDPEADDSSTTSTLTVDAAVAAHIDSGGDVDWFAVQLEAGRNYKLGASPCAYMDCSWASSWGWYLDAKLIDANGKTVGSRSHSPEGRCDECYVAVQIETAGTYYLVVRTGFNFHWTGQKLKYDASARLLPEDEATDGIDTTASLPVTVKESTRGEIQFTDDVDWYRVAVQAGRSHTFSMVGDTGWIAGIFDSAGAQVRDNIYFYNEDGIKRKASAYDYYNELILEPTADGTYYVAVGGYLGSYRVRHQSKASAADPVLSIMPDTASVAEGSDAEFTLTANPAPEMDLAVSVTVSANGDYGAATGQQTVTVSTGGKARLTVATTGDDVDETDGSVTATLDTPAADAGYTISATQGAATVSVADDDDPPPTTPVVSVTAGSGITEGGDATFTISANPAPAANLDVSVTVSANGDYGAATGQQTVTIPTTGSFTLTVGTTNDDADEADGSVTATLDTPAADAGYTVSATQGAATVSVSDDDVPEISVTAGGGVTEGGDASFTVTASPAPAAILDVSVTVSQSGDYGATTGQQTVTIPTTGSVTLTVSTTNDDADEADGSVTATLDTPAADAGYTVSATQGAATVSVTDDDDPLLILQSLQTDSTPEVSITAGSGVTEGGDATFTITANPSPAADLDVSVTVSQSGDYGATTGQQTVTISTTGSATLTVGTTNDGADEADGSVTATLDTPVADAGYTVSATQGAATVTVADDDDASSGYTVDPQVVANVKLWMAETYHGAAHVNRWQRVLVAFGALDANGVSGSAMSAAEAQIYADRGWQRWVPVVAELTALEASQQDPLTTPEVSVTAGSGVTEGGDASFTVTASPAPASSLDVSVTVSQSGDYGATTGQQTVTIPTTGSVTLTVGTSNDGADEADGSVTATLDTPAADAGYTVSATQGAATVSVADDDDPPPLTTPEVSMTAGSGVTEGGDASFTITASPAPAADLDVSVTVSARGDYSVATGQQTVTIPTTGSVTLTVGTTNDGADETDGSVTATLDTPAADAGYTVSSSQGAATVSVSDDDVPEISISAGNGVTEGGDASFTVTASPAPAADLDVSVTVSQSGNYGAATGARTVTIPTTGSVTLTVGTTNDGADEADGSVTATLDTPAADAGYTVSASQGAATVSVADDDVPEISISAGSGVTEGGDASFTVTASPAPAASLDVSVTVSQSGDYGATTGQQTVTIPTAGSVTLTVGTTDDGADEADGSVTATLDTPAADAGYTVSASQGAATVSVADDDDAPGPEAKVSVTVEDASGTEGDVVKFRILLSHALTEEFEVSWYAGPAYHLRDDRAHSSDYQAMSDVMVFAPGETALTGVVWLNDDSEEESDEYFAVEAYLPGEWFTPTSVGTMTIVDDD